MRILHVCNLNMFIPPFVELIHEEFGFEDHYWWIGGDFDKYHININHPHIHRAKSYKKENPKAYFLLINFAAQLHRAC